MLTESKLNKVYFKCNIHAYTLFNVACKEHEVSNRMYPIILANVIHESGGFNISSESLYYNSAERIVKIWPLRFSLTGGGGKNNANNFIRDEKRLADAVYSGRMGNRLKTLDAYYFRGGGYAQITGRDAYESFYNFINKRKPSFDENLYEFAEQVRANEKLKIESIFWFLKDFKKIKVSSIINTFERVRVIWNGGRVGFSECKEIYINIKKQLP